jgi:hypothetical protein
VLGRALATEIAFANLARELKELGKR